MVNTDFLKTASEAEAVLDRLRKKVFALTSGAVGEEECLNNQAGALFLMASEDCKAEFLKQSDNALDGSQIDGDKLISLVTCCDNAWRMLGRLDEIWQKSAKIDEDNFLDLMEIEIQILENLATIPDYPDVETLKEKAQIGRRVMEEMRAEIQFDEDAYEDFEEFAIHTGTMLVRSMYPDSAQVANV